VVGNRIVVHIGLRPFQLGLAIVIQASTEVGLASRILHNNTMAGHG
jgi:hypothetical protein